ncbi:hypothetical protein QT970_03450 [Microcoleus sp. herbarium8]|uniref:hypothetical protein n=1 Tax=Microcoleus sp. herbarium8 TaxID=3055436 RepID=UPI002FD25439
MNETDLSKKDVKPFIKTMLINDFFRESFPKLPTGAKINIIFQYLTGTQTERYAAEPVYSKTGVGKLESKGVQGIIDDEQLIKNLSSNRGRKAVQKFARMVESELETAASV